MSMQLNLEKFPLVEMYTWAQKNLYNLYGVQQLMHLQGH